MRLHAERPLGGIHHLLPDVTRSDFILKSGRRLPGRGLLLGCALWAVQSMVLAAAPVQVPVATQVGSEEEAADIVQSVQRMHQASLERSFTGTFVVLSATGQMASSRILHACNGREQIERVDVLGGAPRTVFRRNEEVRTFNPQTRTVHIEHVSASRKFPSMALQGTDNASLAHYYQARRLGSDRVAGQEAQVLQFVAKDEWRYGYRVWLEKASGLTLKVQTLAPSGQMLEQAAFLEIDLSTPVPMESLARAMEATKGYRVAAGSLQPLPLEQVGWTLREAVPGFEPRSCHRRQVVTRQAAPLVQCIYSDGMAAVSIFFEPLEPGQRAEPLQAEWGATHMLAQRIAPDVWFTAVGEVPMATLRQFAGKVQRTR